MKIDEKNGSEREVSKEAEIKVKLCVIILRDTTH